MKAFATLMLVLAAALLITVGITGALNTTVLDTPIKIVAAVLVIWIFASKLLPSPEKRAIAELEEKLELVTDQMLEERNQHRTEIEHLKALAAK